MQYNVKHTLAKNIQDVVTSSIQATKKEWSMPGASKYYYKEKDELVRGVTDAVMQSLEVRHGMSSHVLQSAGEQILEAVHKVVQGKKRELEGILETDDSKGKPQHVAKLFRDSDLENSISEGVWDDCKTSIAKEGLRLAMIEQMKKEITPKVGVLYGDYTVDRDKVVERIVNQSMAKLPKDLSADTIFKNQTRILENFKATAARHYNSINEYLQSGASSSATAEATIMGYSSLPVQTRIARSVLRTVPTQYGADVKRKALDDLMSEVRETLKDPRKGGFKAVSWMKYGSYDQQRDALVDQMTDDIKERLRSDKGVAADMLYNNREQIVDLVRLEAQKQKQKIEDFLNKKENKGKDISQMRKRWEQEGQEVTGDICSDLSQKLKENVSVKEKREKEAGSLMETMTKFAREQIKAVHKEGKLPWTSHEYHVERDTMAQEMVRKTMSSLEKLSEGALKINHDRIIESFQEALDTYTEEIHGRVNDMVEQTKASNVPFLFSGSRAQSVLNKRVGEARDLNVVNDIADLFGGYVNEIHKVEKVQEDAKAVAAGLKQVVQTIHDIHDTPVVKRSEVAHKPR